MNPIHRNPNPGDAGGADGQDGRLKRFEELLKEPLDASRVDWAEMERALLARVQAAEEQGPLLSLKAEAIPPGDFLDRVETALMARIQDHREYQEPVNELISGSENLSDSHWQRLESKLGERLRAASQLETWEQALKADEEPSSGRWERIEHALDRRLEPAKALEPWERALKAGEIPAEGPLETLETGLLSRVAAVRNKPEWELALKAEKALPAGRWEALEEKLATRIERERKLAALSAQPVWLSLGFFSRGPVKLAASLVLALGVLAGSVKVYQDMFRPIDTLIYQAQGSSAGDLDSVALAAGRLPVIPGHAAVQAKEDGSVVMVNRRGFVDMRNGSRLELSEANKRKLHYKVAFANAGKSAAGNVTFFVNRSKTGEKFTVSTPDYRIEVLGTYFRMDPDLDGRVTTAVLEGSVRIRTKANGDFLVEAGQSLAYDPASGRYRVLDGGRSVPRDEIETMPGVEELMDFGVLSLTSDAPQAEVRIDGRYRGITPLVVLLPPGPHSLHLTRDGYSAYDSLVSIREGVTSRMAAVLAPLPKPAVAQLPVDRTPPKTAPAPVREPAEPAVPEAPEVAETAAQLFHRADEAQATDWKTAILLYLEVLEHPQASPMRKEAAQFSIARLRADHEEEKSRAKEDFLRYLALYPDGAFAGESWMRLAELEVGKNPDKAIAYYLRCIAKFPRHHRLAEFQHRLGLIYLQNKRYDEAVAMFRQSLGNVLYNSESERRRIYGSLYRAYVAKGDLKSAALIGEQYRSAADSAKSR